MKTMLFNPYSGLPRHPSDIASDPEGILMPDPDEPLRPYVAKHEAQRQAEPEPVMIYHGRCVIDCGEHGHQDVELLKFIPAGAKLYTAPAPAQVPLTEQQTALNVAEVGEFAAQSANRHLSALLDLERQIADRAMAVMRALQEAASPIEGERMDCFIPAAPYRQFVDAHAELLYVRKNGALPDAPR